MLKEVLYKQKIKNIIWNLAISGGLLFIFVLISSLIAFVSLEDF